MVNRKPRSQRRRFRVPGGKRLIVRWARLSDGEEAQLQAVAKALGVTPSAALRRGLDILAAQVAELEPA